MKNDNLTEENGVEYKDLVYKFASVYLIPRKRLYRRRFRRHNGGIKNAFSPIEKKVDNLHEFMEENAISSLNCLNKAFYYINMDLIAVEKRKEYSRIEELVHAMTSSPLLARKNHLQKDIPWHVLYDKEYLDHMLIMDFSDQTGEYKKLKKSLILNAEIGFLKHDYKSIKLLELNDKPEERFDIAQKYLRDVANAARRGYFDWSLYSFGDRVDEYSVSKSSVY